MDQGYVLKIAHDALILILMLCAPALVVGLLVGVIISILQAATQIQEQTLSFVPKIIAIFFSAIDYGFLDDEFIDFIYEEHI